MGNRFVDRRTFIAGLGLAGFVGGRAQARTPLDHCETDRVTITGDFGKAVFNVDVADTDATRSQGLMHVAALPLSKGMLFVYQRPQILSFWMRNTLIELDMLFIDSFGVIEHIHERAQPHDETPISPGSMLLTGVLEINGGLARRLGIKAGDVLRHPAFLSKQEPWQCS
ncbi:DUF192 domain-containing protein [Sulfitobacter guttiformis]|uniref:DUF192 domain-containing protein n=1 Tax=Sulfitobacter guttiformis TaxID=74349 RepID=A0A420DN32_9RHOB|nr:DUF192 domain-containing protein [Sulfitobacter guttiformis]KIN72898.1 hypothetical protein Z949_2080 [Sulfitobacter guttiformis KCTC 32187]RKE95587.1 hypothetical protein C8N30_0124 [Sulfitobacter guttiformis]